MSEQELPQLPKDQKWEYATLISTQTAGFFGTIGAKHAIKWGSTLADEGESNFEESMSDLLYQVGQAGWELVTSTNLSTDRGGTTKEITLVLMFKQRTATTEEHALAQLIDPAALLKRASRYLQQQNASMAMKALNRALSLNPQQRELYHLARARCFLILNDDQRVIDESNQAIKANGQCGEAYLLAGDIRVSQSEYEKAINNYTEALRLIRDDYQHPGNGEMITAMRLNRGLAYRAVGRSKEAIKDLKEYMSRKRLESNERAEVEGWIKDLDRRR